MARACPACSAPGDSAGAIGTFPLRVLGEVAPARLRQLSRSQFDLRRCAVCGLVYLSPEPTQGDFDILYRDRRQFGPGTVYTADHRNVARDYLRDCVQRIRVARGRDRGDPLRVLEVGAGLAVLSEVVKAVDPMAVAVAQDISDEGVPHCPWVDRYLVGELADVGETLAALGPYDVISLTHVLEHVPDPVPVLARLARMLSGRGVVLVTAPHRPPHEPHRPEPDAWAAYSYLHVPEHLQYFTEQSLATAAARADLDVVRWDASHEDGQAFEAWLERAVSSEDVRRALAPGVADLAHHGAIAFRSARPFPHVMIDGFLDPGLCAELLAEFPPSSAGARFEEFGRPIGKVTVEGLWALGPAFARFDSLVRSRPFLALIEKVTGIPDLLFDPHQVGGGTHDNVDGQALHPHVDFNYHPSRGWHRRLNLIVYLNPVWEPHWGGSLDLHSNPRDPGADQVARYLPVFNRAVLFETSESSWHGFEKLRLPAAGPRSRRSISIYYYSADRPLVDTAASHSTVYVPPSPLDRPPDEAAALMEEWAGLLEHYQLLEKRLAAQIDALRSQLVRTQAAIRPPVVGFVKIPGEVTGYWPDGWAAPRTSLSLEWLRAASVLILRGWRPPGSAAGTIALACDGRRIGSAAVTEGSFELAVTLERAAGARSTIDIDCSEIGAAVARGDDTRALAYVWVDLTAQD